jgi:acetolactate synthase I/II/III large subunit
MKLTGGEIVVESLIKHGVPYAIGIPGHGSLALADAFIGREKKIKLLKTKQEMSAVHMADGFYRVTGQPLMVFTSIGPGAINTAIGAATAFVESTSVMIISGNAHTHMRGQGLLQEIERVHDANFPRVLEPVVKRYWKVENAEKLPTVMARAFNQMLSGRRGPVLIDLPMDVQADGVEGVEIPEPAARRAAGRVAADPAELKKAAALLAAAKRPVILVGGGVHSAGAYAELLALAETTGAAVVTTMQGKSAFPEDHPLYAWHTGSKGTTVGLKMTRSADALLAVGCRFADETACSYKHGVAFTIPPTKLIHIDIDPAEIGKNYPVAVGVVADAKSALAGLAALLKRNKKDYARTAYFRELQKEKGKWAAHVKRLQGKSHEPPTISRLLKEVRDTIARDAFVVHSSGNTQAQILQEFPFYEPGTCVTSGGFSCMGFALPAALGVKLAHPKRQVLAVVGDGDFMMTMQELSTAVEYGLNVVAVVADNAGWLAIKDLQQAAYGVDRPSGTDFLLPNGKPHYVDFAKIAEGFGCYSEQVCRARDIAPALARCLKAGRPALLDVKVFREFPDSGSPAVGWWDVPIPTYLKERRAKYEKDIKKEKL